ncbi:hypothetical protein HanXRQr2_Chr01g0038711 [Helianthus annuus]|uniref:Uncharacterized protein n=1 Tax=Helianthus annuus TaxID=4232 RepID=A0A9K3P4F4_HELAN|nr:hypothetical protein HanXRQr2_Chr01g0038711 [Helianthus annuus]KAJ0624416.1 hypothetical protein HanIR_Chr01g0042811 [Helianthus annuus]KAJ0793714.1 hypothetical protein HanOQP8_Chr01g0032341 [Helianthus annuus]KAJ0958305.1 hypothetical protein HanPSC8_Chr01g0037441 [Helianthus annuus]
MCVFYRSCSEEELSLGSVCCLLGLGFVGCWWLRVVVGDGC